MWTEILKAREFVKAGDVLNIGSGVCMYFWDDVWIGEYLLKQLFPSLFVIARQKNALASELISSEGAWILNFPRNLNDQEMLELENLLQIIGNPSRLVNEDSRQWRYGEDFSVANAYAALETGGLLTFPDKHLYNSKVP
ncbi:uncharacterized protein LOC113324513 [Papaver somniferum]|uniref:uncharacterized protein LOC113324513 n=1 Tax=Papaver somniferum TaxID=3469 RepID=UPI000E6F7499|nr:uncharacterized protein LOC113324513 [Papaver somniferum]